MSSVICSFIKYDNCEQIYDGFNLREFVLKSEVGHFTHWLNGDYPFGGKRISELTNSELEDLFQIYKGYYIHSVPSIINYIQDKS